MSTEETTKKPEVNLPIFYDEEEIPLPKKAIIPPEWIKCVRSYIRDFMIENSDFKREQIERPGVPPMRMHAFNGCGAILRRRVKLNAKKHPIMRLYKCIDTESEQEMYDSDTLPQQSDDKINCVITCTDLTLEATISEQFSGDDNRFNVFIVGSRRLLDEGWTPMYDRGYVYWYPPIVPEYLYGAPEFSADHLPDQCIDY
jgi:hypothetical protein